MSMDQNATGMEVGLGPGHIVLDGDQAPLPQRGTVPQIFGSCLLWPNAWMNQDATWYGGRPPCRRHCARWGPSSPPKKGHRPHFLAHVCCGQTVAHLSYCWALVGISVTEKVSNQKMLYFPPHLTTASALPGKQETPEIAVAVFT